EAAIAETACVNVSAAVASCIAAWSFEASAAILGASVFTKAACTLRYWLKTASIFRSLNSACVSAISYVLAFWSVLSTVTTSGSFSFAFSLHEETDTISIAEKRKNRFFILKYKKFIKMQRYQKN